MKKISWVAMQDIRNSFSQPARLSIGNVAGGNVLVIVFVTRCVCTYVIFFLFATFRFSLCLVRVWPYIILFSYHLLGFVVLQWQYGGRKGAGRSSFRNPPNQLFSWTLKCIPWQSTRTKSAMRIVQAVSMFTWIADFMERVETTADPVHTALTLSSHTSCVKSCESPS